MPEQRRLIQYLFENSYAPLNPRRSIGESISSSPSAFQPVSKVEGRSRVKSVLDSVALPASAADRSPSQLSGGQRQRAAIARALIVRSELLIWDEITSALDVSVQAVIVELLNDLRLRQGRTLIFVSHNLALVGSIAEQVAIPKDGNIVEAGNTHHLLASPGSQEVQDLLRDAPKLGRVS